MTTPTYYYALYSDTSINSMAGFHPKIMIITDQNIAQAAYWEMRKSGETLEDMAGIPWKEDANGNMLPERKLTNDEVLQLSVKKLGDDGRMFKIFNIDDKECVRSFILAAKTYGLANEARKLVNM